jgi:hypothetical protein
MTRDVLAGRPTAYYPDGGTAQRRSINGSWLLAAGDGPTWFVAVQGKRIDSRPADPGAGNASATIAGTSRDLLALLLARTTVKPLRITGDVTFVHSFSRAFPGP